MNTPGFKIKVEIDPDAPTTPMFDILTRADLELKIMQLECLLVHVDQCLQVVEVLIPQAGTTRQQIAEMLRRPDGKKAN